MIVALIFIIIIAMRYRALAWMHEHLYLHRFATSSANSERLTTSPAYADTTFW